MTRDTSAASSLGVDGVRDHCSRDAAAREGVFVYEKEVCEARETGIRVGMEKQWDLKLQRLHGFGGDTGTTLLVDFEEQEHENETISPQRALWR